MLADPEALRERLGKHQGQLGSYLATLGPSGETTVRLLLASTDPPDVDERAALESIGRDLDTKLVATWLSGLPEPSSRTVCDIKLLTDHYRRSQERVLAELARRYDTGPSLRIAHRSLQRDSLLTHHELASLPAAVERDLAGRAEQHDHRLAYEAWREQAARKLAREAGPLGRLTHSREQYYPQLDREHLTVCERCNETIYPGAPRTDIYGHRATEPCHYCESTYYRRPYDPDANASSESETQP